MTPSRAEGPAPRRGAGFGHNLLIALLASSAPSAGVVAQSVAAQPLGERIASSPVLFTEIGGVRALRDGRLVVLDAGELVVVALDSMLRDRKPIARRGNGPLEYALPRRLFSLGNDPTAVLDWGNSRLLTITADAAPDTFLPAQARCQTLPGSYPLYLAADRYDRFYSEGPLTPGPGVTRDSTPILRWRGECTGDTVAFLHRPPPARGSEAFRTASQWAVSADGAVAIVKPDPYRVTVIGIDGVRREGPTTPFRRTAVDDAVKAAWREQQERPMSYVSVDKSGRVTGGVGRKPYLEPDRWPSELPPFEGRPGVVSFDADGTLWVRRAVGPSDDTLYHVFDQNGRLVKRLTLPRDRKVVGFGPGIAFVVRTDEDGFQHLERYRIRE